MLIWYYSNALFYAITFKRKDRAVVKETVKKWNSVMYPFCKYYYDTFVTLKNFRLFKWKKKEIYEMNWSGTWEVIQKCK